MARVKSGQIDIVLDLITQIAKNLLMGSRTVRDLRLKRPRTSTIHTNVDEFLTNYAFAGLNLLQEHVGEIKGKSVCEIGPGDYLTSGLSILASGASFYCVIDRFPGDYFGDAAKQWYREIENNWPRFYPEIPWDETISADRFPGDSVDRLELIGESIEDAVSARRYDIVCSFQVGEHVSDIEAFAAVHNRLMADNGVGLHRVDFSQHDVWSAYRDPATFLRFSDRVWNLTGSNRGIPNRKRHHEFLAAFDRAGLNVEVLFTDSFDRSVVDLKKLHRKFREMPLDSVLTGTAIYRLTKRQTANGK